MTFDRREPMMQSQQATAVVHGMSPALDFYLALGFEVHSVADGWVLLRAGITELVLVESTASPRDPGRGQLTS